MCGYVRLCAHFGESQTAKKPCKPYIKISVGHTLGRPRFFPPRLLRNPTPSQRARCNSHRRSSRGTRISFWRPSSRDAQICIFLQKSGCLIWKIGAPLCCRRHEKLVIDKSQGCNSSVEINGVTSPASCWNRFAALWLVNGHLFLSSATKIICPNFSNQTTTFLEKKTDLRVPRNPMAVVEKKWTLRVAPHRGKSRE